MRTPASFLIGTSFLWVAGCAITLPGRSETNQTAAALESPALQSAEVVPATETYRVLPPRTSNPNSPHAVNDIVRLTQSGIDESVILSYVEGSGHFELSADQLAYLNEAGVSQPVIKAMLAHHQQSRLLSTQSNGDSQAVASSEIADAANETALRQDRQNSPALPGAADPTNPAMDSLVEVAAILNPTSFTTPQTATLTETPATGQGPGSPKQPQPRQSPPATASRRVYYPVREPYPVELTAPIVFLQGPTL